MIIPAVIANNTNGYISFNNNQIKVPMFSVSFVSLKLQEDEGGGSEEQLPKHSFSAGKRNKRFIFCMQKNNPM